MKYLQHFIALFTNNCNWIYISLLSHRPLHVYSFCVHTQQNWIYIWINISILDTLKISSTKSICHIFMLIYFTSLSFWSFDAVVIFSRCKQEENWSRDPTHISLRPIILPLCEGDALKQELYKWNTFFYVGLNGLMSNSRFIYAREPKLLWCKHLLKAWPYLYIYIQLQLN